MREKTITVVITAKVPKLESRPEIDVDPVLVQQMINAGEELAKGFRGVNKTMKEFDKGMNRLGLSTEDYKKLCEVASLSGVSVYDVERAVMATSSIWLIDPHWEPPKQPPTPGEERQRAHERSKEDRRRKSRKGEYKWGGSANE